MLGRISLVVSTDSTNSYCNCLESWVQCITGGGLPETIQDRLTVCPAIFVIEIGGFTRTTGSTIETKFQNFVIVFLYN